MSDFNKPTFTKFENGMVVVNVANPVLNTSTIGFTVGSRNDPLWLDGMAHFFEHLSIRESYDILDRVVNRMMRRRLGGTNGGGMNVYTMHSHTAYGHQDLLRRKYLHEVFGIFAHIVRDSMRDIWRMRTTSKSIFTAKALDVEAAAVGNETAENDEFSPHISYKAACQLLYQVNPMRRFGDSDPDQLDALQKIGRVKLWGQGHYVPENMRVILLGPTRDEAVRMVRSSGLNELPAHAPALWGYDRSDDSPVLTDIRSLVIDRPIGAVKRPMHHVRILLPAPLYTSPDALALEVLAAVLKDRIEVEMRENNRVRRGGVYHPSVEYDCSSSHGFLDIWFATRGDWEHTQELIAQTVKVWTRIKDDSSLALDEDVRDSRQNLADDFLETYRYGPGMLADRILKALANGDDRLERMGKYHRNILRVTSKQVRRVAADYLHPDRFVQVIVRPVP